MGSKPCKGISCIDNKCKGLHPNGRIRKCGNWRGPCYVDCESFHKGDCPETTTCQHRTKDGRPGTCQLWHLTDSHERFPKRWWLFAKCLELLGML